MFLMNLAGTPPTNRRLKVLGIYIRGTYIAWFAVAFARGRGIESEGYEAMRCKLVCVQT